MKKVLLLNVLGFAAIFAPTASASFISCQTIGSASGSVAFSPNPATLTCSSIVVPVGFTLTGVDLQLIDDAQGPVTLPPASTIQWTWNTFTGVTQAGSQVNQETSPDGLTFGSCTAVSGSIVNTCPSVLSYVANVAAGENFNAVSVKVSAAATSGGLDSGGSDSARLAIQYDYTPIQTGTPEPATIAMLGSALIGLGLIGRKRFVG